MSGNLTASYPGGVLNEISSPEVSNRVLTVPNAISLVRLGLVPVFVWAALTGRNLLAFILLVTVGSTDWVDGFVARRTGQVSVLGKLLDPVADRVAVVAALGVFAFQQTVPRILAGVILAREALVALAFGILESKGEQRIEVNRTGKAATALIYVGMGWAAAGRVVSPSSEGRVRAVALSLMVAGAALYWVAAFQYALEIRRRSDAKVVPT